MAKVPTLIFSLVAVFSFLIWGRAEDTSATLRRAQALEKAGQSRESIPIYLDVLHSDPQCLEADAGLGVNGGEDGSIMAGRVGTTPPRLDGGELGDHDQRVNLRDRVLR